MFFNSFPPKIFAIFAECKISLRLALPLIISELIYGLSGFISTIIVAHLGREALAANALVWNIFIALILFFAGILSAVSIMVSHSYGAHDKAGIRKVTQQGIVFAILLSAPMMLTMLIAPEILIWSGQEQAVIELAKPYFKILIWTMLPINLLIVLEQFLIGVTLTRLALLLSIVSVPLQLFFGFIFTFGVFGVPAMGLSGMGYGIVISNVLALFPLILYVHFAGECRGYNIFIKFWHFNRKYFYELLRVGTPIGGMYCIEVALFAVIALMMGKFGANVLAAHQIAFQCFMFALTFIFGLSQGVGIRVGHEVGRQNKAAVKFTVYVNLGIGFCAMLLVSMLYIIFPKWVIGLDLDVNVPKYHALVNNAIIFLSIAAILQLFDCCRLIIVSALRALKDTKVPMYISIVGFWLIAFPLAYVLGFRYHFGGQGIWWALMIGLLVTAIISFMRFNRLLKQVDLGSVVTSSDNG